jgi:hypothetical protein
MTANGDDQTETEEERDARYRQEWLWQFFSYSHLHPELQRISASFQQQAGIIIDLAPRNPERTTALRKLLEAKDCAVRAVIAGGER